ncbi:MAG: sensor histidine kinase [Candidatus Eisenbacteria bacterium]|uniref:Oxygen sensor histidine kinase NreB n=1 Tax=Eiseniibacteriota bacterium TaxID=2212470 RepID=A0A538TJA4_UNCEI|nr:MAG: sensor histidine kinase [Candidatus Eisenbacteria bacterium]
MRASRSGLEERCARALRRHLEGGGEDTLHESYEFGRLAMAEGVGVLDMALLMLRVTLDACRDPNGNGTVERAEGFVLECLSPFEMAYRGAWEANQALRHLDERREEQARGIGRELHDVAGQLLATAHLALERLRPHLAPAGTAGLEQVAAALHQVEDELRRLAHELRPAILEDLGLVPALRFLGEGLARRSKLTVAVEGSTRGRLAAPVETALYRVAQEALSNVARHSGASRAALSIERTEREVVCCIRDNGCGFDPAAAALPGPRRGLGLAGIRERVTRLGGTMDIVSQPQSGAELWIRIPLEVSYAHAHSDRG